MVRYSAFTIALALPLAIWGAWFNAGMALTNGAIAPEVAGENWLNSKPLTMAELKGRVVMVEFWTYG